MYTVMDVFQAGLPPVPDTTNPPQGSPLFNYLVPRLFASFDIPGGVLKYFDWMNTPDHDTGIWFAIRRDVAWHTIMEEWPRIKADIDGGMLSPLALVTVYTTDPTMMGHNHQVAAYAYEVDDANGLTLHLYDPNTAPPGADDVQLSVDLSNPTHTSPTRTTSTSPRTCVASSARRTSRRTRPRWSRRRHCRRTPTSPASRCRP